MLPIQAEKTGAANSIEKTDISFRSIYIRLRRRVLGQLYRPQFVPFSYVDGGVVTRRQYFPILLSFSKVRRRDRLIRRLAQEKGQQIAPPTLIAASEVRVYVRLTTDVCIVEVYKWIVLALSISLDFWLRWLVHEA
jgi:hypothetical protein